MMGVSQPALYGIELILKRPLYAVIIAGGLGGLYAGLFNVRAFAFANPSLAALPVYLDAGNNIIHTVIMMLIAFVAGFALTWVFGFEEPDDEVVAQTTA
jgi:PTS system beta-glucosides-specific IIC component